MNSNAAAIATARATWIAACDANEFAQDTGKTEAELDTLVQACTDAYDAYVAAQDMEVPQTDGPYLVSREDGMAGQFVRNCSTTKRGVWTWSGFWVGGSIDKMTPGMQFTWKQDHTWEVVKVNRVTVKFHDLTSDEFHTIEIR